MDMSPIFYIIFNVKSFSFGYVSLLKNMLDACGGALGFYTIGFGLAFGGVQDGKTFAGNDNFALRNFEELDYSFFFFQFRCVSEHSKCVK